MRRQRNAQTAEAAGYNDYDVTETVLVLRKQHLK